ncbi:addiction module protein [Nannocystaceae bacterium ST9]
MTEATTRLLDEVLALPDDERTELMSALSDSLASSPVAVDPAWRHELERRIAEAERGEVEPVAWEQVEARIRATLARH